VLLSYLSFLCFDVVCLLCGYLGIGNSVVDLLDLFLWFTFCLVLFIFGVFSLRFAVVVCVICRCLLFS